MSPISGTRYKETLEHADVIEMDPLPHIGHEIVPQVIFLTKIFSRENVESCQMPLNITKLTKEELVYFRIETNYTVRLVLI